MDLESLYLSNQNLVYSCMKKYFWDGVVWDEDLVQSGFEGLWKALLRYDKEKSAIGNWAWFWIRKEVQRALKMVDTDIVIDLEGQIDRISSEEKSVEEVVYEKELRGILCEFLNMCLTELEKEVLVRKIMYEENFWVIGDKVGLGIKDVQVVFENALEKVRSKKELLRKMLGEGVE